MSHLRTKLRRAIRRSRHSDCYGNIQHYIRWIDRATGQRGVMLVGDGECQARWMRRANGSYITMAPDDAISDSIGHTISAAKLRRMIEEVRR